MTKTFDIHLRGEFRLRSPLSHIGETVGNVAYLAQEPVIQPDRTVEEVFSYAGNAWRGHLRDLMAERVAEALGGGLSLDAFHLLFSGGRIIADKGPQLEQVRRVRAALPMVSLLGAGIGTQIVTGKIQVYNCYPVCREAIPVLPGHLHNDAGAVSYGSAVFEREFSRHDDARRSNAGRHLATADDWLAAAEELNREVAEAKKGKVKERAPDQMRMGVELLGAGTRLWTEIRGQALSVTELGCLTLALHDFGSRPFIGGQGSRGHGHADLHYAENEWRGRYGDGYVVTVKDGMPPLLSDDAKHCLVTYERHLAEQAGEIREALQCV